MARGANAQASMDGWLRRAGYTEAEVAATRKVVEVLPFKVSQHIVERLIDWSAAPDDPIFRLYFPHPDMLEPGSGVDVDVDGGGGCGGGGDGDHRPGDNGSSGEVLLRLNPHPGKQLERNVPRQDGEPVRGLQHKYADTVLVFPGRGQTCHAYCAYCFRWAQFVGAPDLQMRMDDPGPMGDYLDTHPEVSNVIFTGGDPFVMGAHVLAPWLDAACAAHRDHIDVVRIGTKAPLSNPERFTRAADADALMAVLERVTASGRQLAIMLHTSHARELEDPLTQQALVRLRSAGATLYSQAPLIHRVNDDAEVWRAKWALESRLGIVPYYMFVERDTGPWRYFAVPLADAVAIFSDAYGRVGGLARTVRGPVMSTTIGKLHVSRSRAAGDDWHFDLTFLRARDPDQQGTTLQAHRSTTATWVSELDGVTLADQRVLAGVS